MYHSQKKNRNKAFQRFFKEIALRKETLQNSKRHLQNLAKIQNFSIKIWRSIQFIFVFFRIRLSLHHNQNSAKLKLSMSCSQLNLRWFVSAQGRFHLTNFNRVYVMRCAIWYHLYNLKNVKNTHGGVLLFVKMQATVIGRLHSDQALHRIVLVARRNIMFALVFYKMT